MDFTINKPTHLFALLLLIVSFLLIIILPILSYINILPTTSTDIVQQLPEPARVIFDIIILLFELLLVFGLFIVVPLLWYILVNRLNLKQILSRINLRFERFPLILIWGILAAISAFAVAIGVELVLTQLSVDLSNASNIPQLEQLFSLPAILILITVQPIAEEILFRGFLLEKIQSFAGDKIAIGTTAVLFGIAHLSAGLIYPAFMATLMGVIFAYVVLKTKNLYTAIIAHILMNVASITLYLFAKSLGI